MLRPLTVCLLAILCVSTLAAFLPIQDDSQHQPRPGSPKRVPLVVVDRTGGTLLGPAHMHLLVYNDGHVVYGSRSGAPGDAHDFHRRLDLKAVQGLHARLLAAGAMTLGDQTMQVTDVPLTTVTVLEPKARASANSFSYWIGVEGHEPVETLLRGFIQEHVLAKPLPGKEQ